MLFVIVMPSFQMRILFKGSDHANGLHPMLVCFHWKAKKNVDDLFCGLSSMECNTPFFFKRKFGCNILQ